MNRAFWMHWEVDGASGSTLVSAPNAAEVRRYFDMNFAPFGYVLVSIERI